MKRLVIVASGPRINGLGKCKAFEEALTEAEEDD
jgi:hypothetical protein